MVKDYYNYMFNKFDYIDLDFSQVVNLDNVSIYKALQTYVVLFEENLDKNEWFDRVKRLAQNSGFCTDNKKYKANPDKYNGNLATFCNFIRYAFTGRTNTPDLYSICCVLGKDELYNRLGIINKKLNA